MPILRDRDRDRNQNRVRPLLASAARPSLAEPMRRHLDERVQNVGDCYGGEDSGPTATEVGTPFDVSAEMIAYPRTEWTTYNG